VADNANGIAYVEETMKVFISWSGDRSFALANALRRWLKLAVQSIEPWVSSKDIVAGQRWGYVLGKELADTRFGIICVTPENIGSPWLMFESGAIGKSLDDAHVVPLLLGLKAEDLRGPLAQFQSLQVDRDGIRTLTESLHRAAQTRVLEQEVSTLFDALWPQLEREISEIPSQSDQANLPKRTEREVLDELVTLIRGLKIAPDDREILRALKMLAGNIRADLEYARESEKTAATATQGSTTYDFRNREMERDLGRVEAATRVLEARGEGVEASKVRIINFNDLVAAIEELWSDYSYREYQMELRGRDDESLRGMRREMAWIEEIQKVVQRLQKESSEE
jgi:hypothetical protein